jgi:tetratricopeptide (TPR) repeat protein
VRYATPFLLLLAGLVAPSSSPSESPEILLDQLASPDPQTRTSAADKLLSLGVVARPHVLDAARSRDPEIRARAAELILKLPWSKPADPGEVQRVLAQYGQHDPATRAHAVSQLANFPNHVGLPALVRLLTEDPSDAVRWAVVYHLHGASGRAADAALAPLRDLDPADQPAPVLAALALARRASDLPKAQSLYQQASDALIRNGAPAQQHLTFGEILLEHGLRTLARKEFETALSLPGPHPPVLEANAHFQLASLIGDADDRAAADHIKSGLAAFNRLSDAGLTVDHAGARNTGNDALADLKAEMHFRYYRAATQSNAPAQADEHLNQLLALNPSRPDVVLEIVPVLKSLGRTDDAKAMFERAYAPLKSATDADPASAESANNLAWLCARCDERLDVAVRLADRAIELQPDNPAYLDTAAEAHFRNGDPAKAVALETRALQLRPGDEFMQQQLKRFQSPPPKGK